ncbi:MAG: carboxypeptidase M32 [bacterium]
MKTEITTLLEHWGDFDAVSKACQILEWDQETMLPERGGSARAMALSSLAKIAHEKLVSKEFRKALKEANAADKLSSKEAAMVREADREFKRAAKVPASLVSEIARAESEGLEAWRKAYKSNGWNDFVGKLATLVRLKRRMADAIGYAGVPYDALLDHYEPGATVKELDPLFEGLRETTVDLVQRIGRSKRKPDSSILTRHYPKDAQLAFGWKIVETMGFDRNAGRIDLSTHPFCSGFGPGDVRLTTRVNERDVRPNLFGVIHEAGHGLYEQGLDEKLMGTPLGTAISLGVHESQSRLWENIVGRSRAFWEHFFPIAKRQFPEALKNVKLADFHFAVNEVTPSFIRVEADEVTYNLHIVLRYEIEKGLFDGSIAPKNLPQVWNAKMNELLGIRPRKDSEGVLQDIHWAMGLYGYFPTYSLGNLYGAQLWDRAQRDIPDLEKKIAAGDLLPLREWLRKKIHQPGRMYSAKDLIRRATGREPSPKYFSEYVEKKFGELYDL